MIFVPVLLILTIVAGVWLLLDGIPTTLGWMCLLIGVAALFSRVLAWATGAAISGYLVLSEIGRGAVMRAVLLEAVIWLTALANVYFFLIRAQ